MTQLIQHVAPNIPTTAASTVDNSTSEHLVDQKQQTEFSNFLPQESSLSKMLEKLRGRLTEDEYVVVELWLTSGESLPLWEEVAGEIVPFLAANIDLLSPQIRERIQQQLALQLPNEGQLQPTQKSWQELKGFFQQLLPQPDNSNSTAGERESFAAAQAQIDLQKPSLSFVPTVLETSLQGERLAGINVMSNMGLSGVETVKSLAVVSTAALATSNQPSAGILNVPLGESGWNQALGRQIRWMIGSEIQGASVQITPPQLGPVEINLLVKKDQANIVFAAQHDQVRDALEAAIPRLREMFREISLDLVNVDVGKKEAGSHHQFSALLSDQSGRGDQTADGYADTQDSAEVKLERKGLVSLKGSGLVDDYA